jgi:hypothetical protein
MTTNRSVLIIGFDPQFLDFSSPDLAPLHLTAKKEGCFMDTGETAENVVASQLRTKEYACVMIGAGVRANPKYFPLFEKLLNVVHELAPKARIAFNTKPTDTVEAVQRWL